MLHNESTTLPSPSSIRFLRGTLITLCLFGTVLVGTARGQEVAWIYPDQWVAEHEGVQHVDAVGRHVVETQFSMDILTAWGQFTSPSGTPVGYGYASGNGSVTIDISFCNDDLAEEGMYDQDVEFHIWGDQEYQGGWALQKVGIGRFAYVLSHIWPGNIVARYVRCNSGSQCKAMDVLKAAISPETSVFPPFLFMRLAWVHIDACLGSNAVQQTSCIPDQFPVQ